MTRDDVARDHAGRLVTPENVARLTAGQQSAVLGLARKATEVDGVAPLSEQVLLAVQHTSPRSAAAAATVPASATVSSRSTHLLAYSGTHLAGYAHLDRDLGATAATAEVVVDPSSRRRGIGTQLLRALEAAAGDTRLAPEAQVGQGTSLQLWSHGDLEGARALAVRRGYSVVRELWQMRRSLQPGRGSSGASSSSSPSGSLPEVNLPEGFRARRFVVGRDEEAWLRVNARAFVDHPEQGRITRQDLDHRCRARCRQIPVRPKPRRVHGAHHRTRPQASKPRSRSGP